MAEEKFPDLGVSENDFSIGEDKKEKQGSGTNQEQQVQKDASSGQVKASGAQDKNQLATPEDSSQDNSTGSRGTDTQDSSNQPYRGAGAQQAPAGGASPIPPQGQPKQPQPNNQKSPPLQGPSSKVARYCLYCGIPLNKGREGSFCPQCGFKPSAEQQGQSSPTPEAHGSGSWYARNKDKIALGLKIAMFVGMAAILLYFVKFFMDMLNGLQGMV